MGAHPYDIEMYRLDLARFRPVLGAGDSGATFLRHLRAAHQDHTPTGVGHSRTTPVRSERADRRRR